MANAMTDRAAPAPSPVTGGKGGASKDSKKLAPVPKPNDKEFRDRIEVETKAIDEVKAKLVSGRHFPARGERTGRSSSGSRAAFVCTPGLQVTQGVIHLALLNASSSLKQNVLLHSRRVGGFCVRCFLPGRQYGQGSVPVASWAFCLLTLRVQSGARDVVLVSCLPGSVGRSMFFSFMPWAL